MGLCDNLNALIEQLPAGATIGAPPKRRHKTETPRTAPVSLSAVLAECRSQLPRSQFSLESAQELRRRFDEDEMVQKYICGLFGDDYEQR